MNFAHIVGNHQFDNPLQAVLHAAVSWMPIIIAVTIGLVFAWFIASRKTAAHQKETYKNNDYRL
jgi:hypothetical protein